MATFFNIDLKEVTKVVLAGTGQSKMTLLFDRGRFRVALGHDDPTEIGSVFTRDLLPNVFAFVITEVNLAIGLAWIQKDSPAVIWHLDVIELRPAVPINAGCGA